MPTPAHCWARHHRACYICWRPGARTRTRLPMPLTPSLRKTARASSGHILPLWAAGTRRRYWCSSRTRASIAEQVQQSKLAALGRLSASIAHEIRNPVGAMSHAAPTARRIGAALAARTSASRKSSAATRIASARSSTMCCSCRSARKRGSSASPSRSGSANSARSSVKPCSWTESPECRGAARGN